jgi:hypothetical protein
MGGMGYRSHDQHTPPPRVGVGSAYSDTGWDPFLRGGQVNKGWGPLTIRRGGGH